MSFDDLIDQSPTLRTLPSTRRPAATRPASTGTSTGNSVRREAVKSSSCSSTAPGHAVDHGAATSVRGQRRDARSAAVDVRVTGVTGEYVVLALSGGPLVARTHAASLLAELLADAAGSGVRVSGRFSAQDHRLHVGDAAYSLALPWHDYVSCEEACRDASAGC